MASSHDVPVVRPSIEAAELSSNGTIETYERTRRQCHNHSHFKGSFIKGLASFDLSFPFIQLDLYPGGLSFTLRHRHGSRSQRRSPGYGRR